MATLITDDGIRLYYEDTGHGTPIVFVHEFGGDHRSWEPQVRHFSRRYRCITYCARGYLPSDIPSDVDRYSPDRWREDVRAVLDALELPRAHIVGISMGAFAVLQFGIRYCCKPASPRALSLTLAACGTGSHPAVHHRSRREALALADSLRRGGADQLVTNYVDAPTRVQFKNKDPRAFAEAMRELAEHSAVGLSNTMAGYLAQRPSLYELSDAMANIDSPVLVIAGDEDEGCLEPSLLLKRTIPKAGLAILPKSGHVVNLEEPALFNQLLDNFFHSVEAGRWSSRDPAAACPSIYGPAGKPHTLV